MTFTTIADDLVVTGSVSATNIIFGSIVMSPEANTPTSTEVKFNHNKPYPATAPNVMLTAVSQEPQTKIVELGTRFASSTGFTAYIFRTNDSDTTVNYLSWQEPDLV